MECGADVMERSGLEPTCAMESTMTAMGVSILDVDASPSPRFVSMA